jgi:hypothetical protein
MVQAPPQSQPLLLQLPSELALQVTSEQFVVLAAANPDLRLERTATGALIVNPPMAATPENETGASPESSTYDGEMLRNRVKPLIHLRGLNCPMGRTDRRTPLGEQVTFYREKYR